MVRVAAAVGSRIRHGLVSLLGARYRTGCQGHVCRRAIRHRQHALGLQGEMCVPVLTKVCSGCGAGCRLMSLVQLKAYRSNRQSAARHGRSGEWHVDDGGYARWCVTEVCVHHQIVISEAGMCPAALAASYDIRLHSNTCRKLLLWLARGTAVFSAERPLSCRARCPEMRFA